MINKNIFIDFFSNKKYNFFESFDISINFSHKKKINNFGLIKLPFSIKTKKFLFLSDKKYKDIFSLSLEKKKKEIFSFYRKNFFFAAINSYYKKVAYLKKDRTVKKIFKKCFILDKPKDLSDLYNGNIVSYKFDTSNSVKFAFANSNMEYNKIFSNLEKIFFFFKDTCSFLNISFNKTRIFVSSTQSKKSLLIKDYE
ncbi:hypothetical protein ACWNX6_00020 [Candidatus Vidania fulgoroideorum]